MIRVEKMLFPGIIAGCVFLVMVTSLISRPGAALAENIAAAPPVMETAAANIAAGAAGSLAQALPIVTVVPTPGTGLLEVTIDEESLEVADKVVGEQPAAVAGEAEAAAAEAAGAVANENQAPDDAGSECAVNAGYPQAVLQWCDWISAYAQKEGLEPNLVAAVMLQESGGSADAYSKSGAVGLLQVMPSDGLASSFMCVNGPCFSARPSMNELFDPEFNIAYGTRMLSGLVKKHGGVRDALYAYGPMNMGYRYADIILDIYNRYQ